MDHSSVTKTNHGTYDPVRKTHPTTKTPRELMNKCPPYGSFIANNHGI